jgi:aquaporin Z
MGALATLRRHWPEYAIEAWALGTFMVSAGLCTLLVEHPDFGVPRMIESALLRRCLIGLAMGVTAVGLIYSPWGRRSGAHMNPAVTLTFLGLGRIARTDAVFYVGAQFLGALLGVALTLVVVGPRLAEAPISYVATVPGSGGVLVAFAAEVLISCGLMAAVLACSNSERLMTYTGLVAGALVAVFIALEAPLSGMSMNPARSFASAAPAGLWRDLWIYLAAPPLGMASAGYLYSRLGRLVRCVKLYHAPDTRCIHCGYEPSHGDQSHAESAIVRSHP